MTGISARRATGCDNVYAADDCSPSRNRIHQPLQSHSARTLEENNGVGFEARRKRQPRARRDRQRDDARVARRDTPERAGELADRGDDLNLGTEGVPRDLVVQTRTLRSKLQHRGEHGDSLASRPSVREQLDRGACRAGIGIVGVVDECRRVRAAPSSRASAAQASPRFRGRVVERDAELTRHSEREHGVSEIVHAAERNLDVDAVHASAVPRPSGIDPPARRPEDLRHRDRRRRRARARRRAASTISGCDAGTIATGTPSVAAISSRSTPARSPSPSRCSSATDVTTATFGSTIARSRGDLARLIRAHLDHGDVGVVGNREQRERNADEIVEIPARRVHLEHARRARLESVPSCSSCRCVPTTPTTGPFHARRR